MSNEYTCNCLFLLHSTYTAAHLKPGLPWLLGLPVGMGSTITVGEQICLLSSGTTTYKPSTCSWRDSSGCIWRKSGAKERLKLPPVCGSCFMIAFPEAGLKSWGFPLCCWLPNNLSFSSAQACLNPSSSFFRWSEQRTHQRCWRVSHQLNTSSQLI